MANDKDTDVALLARLMVLENRQDSIEKELDKKEAKIVALHGKVDTLTSNTSNIPIIEKIMYGLISMILVFVVSIMLNSTLKQPQINNSDINKRLDDITQRLTEQYQKK